MPLLRLLLLLAALLCAPVANAQTVGAQTAGAQTFPKLTGRVVDNANLLDPAQELALTNKLATLEKESGRQVVVATIPDLQGQDISEYAFALGHEWKIGGKEKDDGVLMVVAPTERKIWIANGYGLEGILTDAVTARIYRNAVVPRFKAGDYPGGINAGIDQISELLKLPPDEAAKRAAQVEKTARSQGDDGVSFGMVIFWLVIILFFIVPLVRAFGGGGRRYGRGSGGPPIILWGPSIGSGWGDRGSSGGSDWGGFGGGGSDGGGFSGGGGDFGGGGAGGDW